MFSVTDRDQLQFNAVGGVLARSVDIGDRAVIVDRPLPVLCHSDGSVLFLPVGERTDTAVFTDRFRRPVFMIRGSPD